MAQMKEFCAELKVGARQTHRYVMDAIDTADSPSAPSDRAMRTRAIAILDNVGVAVVEKRKSLSVERHVMDGIQWKPS